MIDGAVLLAVSVYEPNRLHIRPLLFLYHVQRGDFGS